MLIEAIFKDTEIEQFFLENGYAYIQNFLNEKDIEFLFRLYSSLHTHSDSQQKQWNSLYHLEDGIGLDVSGKIKQILSPYLTDTFLDWQFPVGTFMTKNPVKDNISELHRDFTSLDETAYALRNIWIPLVDINETNGALYVIPKSHRLFNDIRPMFAEWPYKHLIEELMPYSKTIYARKGDLVVYADRTLHGSVKNTTSGTRPVVHGGILHESACTYYFKYHNETGKVNKYKVPFDFFLQNNFNDNGLDNKYPLVDSFYYQPVQIDMNALHKQWNAK
jgi:hypothetical protein